MFITDNNRKEFKYGLKNYEASRKCAGLCDQFKADDEDEQVDSVLVSCYNCIYRRWKMETFECMIKEA